MAPPLDRESMCNLPQRLPTQPLSYTSCPRCTHLMDPGPGESQVKSRQHSALDWHLPSLRAMCPGALFLAPDPLPVLFPPHIQERRRAFRSAKTPWHPTLDGPDPFPQRTTPMPMLLQLPSKPTSSLLGKLPGVKSNAR